MKNFPKKLGGGRLMTVTALLGIALLAVLAVPFVGSAAQTANGRPSGDRSNQAPLTVEECRSWVELNDPRRDTFLDELVADAVISADQAAEIDARLDARHFEACVARILWERGNAIEATAAATGTEKREVVGALIAGQSLAEFAAEYGVDEATLVDAIMAAPEAVAAELVNSGQLGQDEANAIIAKIEERVSVGIHLTDVSPRRFGAGQLDLGPAEL